jgi:hydroxymethylbilane synthase
MTAASRALRFGSRGSALALRQTERVLARLAAGGSGVDGEVVVIRTAGDIDQTTPLTVIGGHGLFTSALEAALLAGQIDAAVHSAKDLPSETPPGLALVAFPERAAPEDVLVSRHGLPLADLPPNPVVGTSSRRRALQISLARPDARIVQIRGNLDTRLRKALLGDLDGVVLAAAGIDRMGWQDQITQRLPLDQFIPAPGQGALAVEIRADDERARTALAPLDDPAVSVPVRIERAFLRALGAGCLTPLGAHVAWIDGALRLRAMLADDAVVVWADEVVGQSDPEAHAVAIARRLQAELAAMSPRPDRRSRHLDGDPAFVGELAGLRVLVTRPADRAEELMAALRSAGAEPIFCPLTRIEDPLDWAPLDRALAAAADGAYDWVVVSSANAAARLGRRATAVGAEGWSKRARVAAVGPATARALVDAGVRIDLVPGLAQAEGIVDALREVGVAGARVLYPHGDLARDTIVRELTALGATVDAVVAYRTAPASDLPPAAREALRSGDIDVAMLAAPSSAGRLAEEFGGASLTAAPPVVCVGPVTEAAARALGFSVAAVAWEPSVAALVAALTTWRRGMEPVAAASVHSGPTVDENRKGA